jgi:hypothetical protein
VKFSSQEYLAGKFGLSKLSFEYQQTKKQCILLLRETLGVLSQSILANQKFSLVSSGNSS